MKNEDGKYRGVCSYDPRELGGNFFYQLDETVMEAIPASESEDENEGAAKPNDIPQVD